MMVLFYAGCGLALVAAGLAPEPRRALRSRCSRSGVFAAIYHPVGTAMLIEQATARGRSLAFNGVCGNVGAALAAGMTAALAAAFGWRAAFLVPGVICLATAVVYLRLVPDEERKGGEPRHGGRRSARLLAGGDDLRPVHRDRALRRPACSTSSRSRCRRSLDERLGDRRPAAPGRRREQPRCFMCGALAQLAVGRSGGALPPHILFAVIASSAVPRRAVGGAATSGRMLIVGARRWRWRRSTRRSPSTIS